MDFTKRARNWRVKLGFTSQGACKDYLGGKVIHPDIDEAYLSALNGHLDDLVRRLDQAVHSDIQRGPTGLGPFLKAHRDAPLEALRTNGLLPRLNNQGRRPEEVFFNWMRGHLIVQFFLPPISRLFSGFGEEARFAGTDDYNDAASFRRSGAADLAILHKGLPKAYVEIQSGFSGINDFKRHKWVEAKTKLDEEGLPTFVVHFDLFNGCAALFDPMAFPLDGELWVQRQQMEGQWVLPLDPNWFLWDLQAPMPESHEELLPS